MTGKRCYVCGLTEPATEFYSDEYRGNRGKKICKPCHRAAMKANHQRRRVEMGLPPVGVQGRTDGSAGRELTGDELIPCARCHLRGPHECLRGLESTGLGHQSWV